MATAEAGDLRATLGDQAQHAGMSSAQVLVELTRMRRALVGKTEKCDELARWAELCILDHLAGQHGGAATTKVAGAGSSLNIITGSGFCASHQGCVWAGTRAMMSWHSEHVQQHQPSLEGHGCQRSGAAAAGLRRGAVAASMLSTAIRPPSFTAGS